MIYCLSAFVVLVLKTQLCSCSIGVEETFFRTTSINPYKNYGSIQLFEYTVPEATSDTRWTFKPAVNKDECPQRNITIYIQYGSYPVPPARNNQTYPAEFYLKRTSLHHMEVPSDSNTTTEKIDAPLAGRWFGAAFIDYTESNEVIGKITDLDCDYDLDVNVTSVYLVGCEEIVPDEAVSVNLTFPDGWRLFRFYVENTIYKYRVSIKDCVSDSGDCPLRVSFRGNALPVDPCTEAPYSHTANCSLNTTGEGCELDVNSPLVGVWHYLKVELVEDRTVSVSLLLELKGCSIAIIPVYNQQACRASDDNNQSNSTIKIRSNHTNRSNLSSSESSLQTRNYESSQSQCPSLHDQKCGNQLSNQDQAYKDEASCGPINILQRIEDMNNEFYAVYSLGPQSADELLIIIPQEVAVVRFDVLPIKDTGGTLLFKAVLTEAAISLNHTQNVTVRVCVSRSMIPANGTQYSCPKEGAFELTLDTGEESQLAERHIPYPEPGLYFCGFQSFCYVLNGTEPGENNKIWQPCATNFTEVVIEIMNGPCVNSDCPGYGSCATYLKGAYIYSTCSCNAKYGGYTCEDGSEADPKNIQLLYTLLLSLSNLLFLPAVVVSVIHGYYVEAIVYFANMFFSGFYHACDMHPWSIYIMCIMPYHVLSYCDFLLSIVSFWVTFIAMAELPSSVASSLHMLGVITLMMAVEWVQHGLLPYIVPIATGLLLVIIMWTVRSARQKACYPQKMRWLYMLPGFILAIVALVIFGFLQDDNNYPYTHSAWHISISLSIVFLLPLRRKKNCCNKSSQDSTSNSDDIEFRRRDDDLNHLIQVGDFDREILVNSDYSVAPLSS